MGERAMTRCECAGLTFEEIARVAEREGTGAFELLRRATGCAATCTACRPDLEAFLARRAPREYAVAEVPVGA